jgi:ACS family pantothenate transporter-like MFS transporter
VGCVWRMFSHSLSPILSISYFSLLDYSWGSADQTSWAHEICTHDNEERAIVVASMNEFAYVIQAWLPLIVWQQVDAPEYRKGYITVTFLSAALIATALVTRLLHARELAKVRPDQELNSEGSFAEEEVVTVKGHDDGIVQL